MFRYSELAIQAKKGADTEKGDGRKQSSWSVKLVTAPARNVMHVIRMCSF